MISSGSPFPAEDFLLFFVLPAEWPAQARTGPADEGDRAR
jgi:hypothetical protein